MTNEKTKTKSPSRLVWRTQIEKGIHTPNRVTKITCTINHLLSPILTEHLIKLSLEIVFVESGRNVVKEVTKRTLLPGKKVSLHDTQVDIFRFTVPRDNTQMVVDSIIKVLQLNIPGRGSIFAQDLIEFSKLEPPRINTELVVEETGKKIKQESEIVLQHKLAYVTCVLNMTGYSELVAKIALDLGICVPLITSGTSSDVRDQLGLIRITIPPEKELVHLVMPEADTEGVFKLLIEGAGLNKPGRGFIYRTPVSAGLIDTLLTIGQQENAASIEQVIAAIDQLKHGTDWRKRTSSLGSENAGSENIAPNDHCEITFISMEDRVDELVEIAMKAGAEGATTSFVKQISMNSDDSSGGSAAQAHTTFSVPGELTNEVTDILLQSNPVKEVEAYRIQVLDSPAAYVQSW